MFKLPSLTGKSIFGASLNVKNILNKGKLGSCHVSTADVSGSQRMGVPRLKGKNVICVCVLGSSRVGKSSIVRRMLGQAFHVQHVPTVYENYIKHVNICDNDVTLDVQDMSGSLHFPAMEKCAVGSANVILIVFALDDFQSCEHAVQLSLRFEENRIETPVILVGNKSDLFYGPFENREKIEDFINNSVQRRYIEMSAKFDRCAHEILKEIYELNEIARGPYRVSTAKSGPSRKLFTKRRSFKW